MTREEFKDTVKRMITEASGGRPSPNDNYCAWLSDCSGCPLGGRNAVCLGNDRRVDALFNTIETVEKWSKEHPKLEGESEVVST